MDYKQFNAFSGEVILVEADTYERFKNDKWYLDTRGYPYRYIRNEGRRVRQILHNLLLQVPHGSVVRHLDGNPLNNRSSNLIVLTSSQFRRSQARGRGKSPYKGVSPLPHGKFHSAISFNYKKYSIGTFESEIDAAVAFDLVAVALDSGYLINFPSGHLRTRAVVKVHGSKIEAVKAKIRAQQ